MVRTACLFFACLLLITGYSQVNRQNIFHHLGLRDGLLSDEANATVQDAKGYIWIAGKNGLQRFDGFRFSDFKHREGDSTSIPDNNITRLAVDKNNRLWLLSANYKLGYFDTKHFLYQQVKVELNGKTIEKVTGELSLDQEKNILLHLMNDSSNNVLIYSEKRKLFSDPDQRFTLPPGWHMLSFSFDSTAGNLWMGTDQGLVKFDTRLGVYSFRGHNAGDDPIINALQQYSMTENPLFDRQGNFWMTASDNEGKNSHLLKYTVAADKLDDYFETISNRLNHAFYKIRNIVQPDTGAVWITGRSIFIKAGERLDFVRSNLPGEFSIYYDDIKSLSTDREKNAWVTTNRGIYYMNAVPSPFMYIPNKKFYGDSVYSNDVTDFIQLPNNHILMASWGNGLFEYDSNFNPVKSEIATQGDEKGEKLVWAMNRSSNGDIWRTQQDGYLYIYHAATHTTEKLHDAVFDNKTIRQIAEDRNGNIWLSTQGNTIIKWNKSNSKFSLVRTTEQPVFRLYADWRGDIWAIAGAAIKIDIENGSILAQYDTGPADGKHLLTGDLTDIIQFTDSTYVISGRGLNIVHKHGPINYFTSANGLPSDYVSNIIAGKSGELWIATENGICNLSFKKQELHIYNMADGIHNSGFTPVSSVLLRDGHIVFGTNQDWMVFNPAAIHGGSRFPPSNVEITGVAVMNKQLSADSLMQLPAVNLEYAGNAIAIQFSSLTYSSRYAIAYMMENLDKKPVNASGRTEAVYSYLPPGHYIFKVGVLDGDGDITHFSSFNITVSAPFWRTWGFYLVLLLLAGFIIWWIDKERIKRVKEVLQMRNSIGKDLHAEVNTTLNKISILSELAAIKADSNLELSKDYIRDIKLKSRSTINAMDDVMWSIDPANDSMPKTIEKMHELADAVKHEYGTETKITVEKGTGDYNLSMKERLEFVLIYKKTIWMMATQLQAATVEVVLQRIHKDLVMTITSAVARAASTEINIAMELDEIKSRADAMNCLLDVQERANYTSITAVIKK